MRNGVRGGTVSQSTLDGQYAEELAELHDGSVSLFVTLPVFRGMLVSEQRMRSLAEFEAGLGEHLAHLDSILGDVFVRRDRNDGDLTRMLFEALGTLRLRAATVSRDAEILGVVQRAQAFLLGSCSFALRFARQAHVDRAVHVLEESLGRIGSIALQGPAGSAAGGRAMWTDAVA
jgi:hypothetical protein